MAWGYRAVLIALAVVELGLGLLLIKSTFSVYDACFVEPCYEGAGWSELWKMSTGASLSALFSASVVAGHALVALFVAPRDSLGDALWVLGFFMGMTFLISLLSLEQSLAFGSHWLLIENLLKIDPSNPTFFESGRHMVVDASLLSSYKRIEWTLIFTLLTQVSMVGTLCYRHRDVMRDIVRADRAYMKIPGHDIDADRI